MMMMMTMTMTTMPSALGLVITTLMVVMIFLIPGSDRWKGPRRRGKNRKVWICTFSHQHFWHLFCQIYPIKNCHRCRDYERLQADFSAKQQELIDLRSAHGRLQKVKKKSSDDEIYNIDTNVAGVVREGGWAKSCCQEGGELRERGPSWSLWSP